MKFKILKLLARQLEAEKFPVTGSRINGDGSYDILLSRRLTEDETRVVEGIMETLGLPITYLCDEKSA